MNKKSMTVNGNSSNSRKIFFHMSMLADMNYNSEVASCPNCLL
jgi:hypothetical protein